MNTKQIKCRRCAGSGNVGGPVVCAGIPGGCFNCLATGRVYVDKFAAQFAREAGTFWGITSDQRCGSLVQTVKAITRQPESGLLLDRRTTATAITEEQAETFFRKYGPRTIVATRPFVAREFYADDFKAARAAA